ncbi:MAG: MBL fold metallo-hydrolase [Gemmatimonadetes bacterium]|nr:MBL fold metallo-hydrolase [Gemmatimonadota bacterium]
MRIEQVTVGLLEENCWVVADPAAGRCVLVDPGDDPERIVAAVKASGCIPEAIWLTHAHFDHVGGIVGVLRAWPLPIFLHPADATLYGVAAKSAQRWGIDIEQPPAWDRDLAEGDVLRVGSATFSVIHVPGHAPGHVAFVGAGVVFGGDCLFAGSIGRTDLPFSSGPQLMQSLERFAALPGETVVHPGHGPSTTIARELATNPFLTGLARPLSA